MRTRLPIRERRVTRRTSRRVDALLVDVCRHPERALGAPALPDDDLVEAARFHRVAPLVHVAMRETDPRVAGLLQADRLHAITMHLHACDALQQLGAALGDIAWATFKGPVYSEHAHPAPGLRTYNDVDVIVDPRRLRDVTDRLRAAGWRVADYADMLRNADVPGEMHWMSPAGVFIDLHWSMINMASRRRLFTVPTDELLARRRTADLGAQQVWTLDTVDALVHGCLHAALSGANKLLYLVDIDGLARNITDWDEVAARSRSWGAQAQTALVLGRARRALGTPVPADLTAHLGVPRAVLLLLRLTDRVAPVEGGRTNSGLSKFVARAVRSTATGTAAAAFRNGLSFARDARSHDGTHAGVERSHADAASLEVYLVAVEAAIGATAEDATIATTSATASPREGAA